ncbi:MAG: hypothetical protein QGI15_05565, partial [Candidatus Scalindua sp.]|nr:hypothetical protein [Candidatus Scalindua sp.]
MARDMRKQISLRVILIKRMEGGEEVYSLRRHYGKTLFLGVFFCVVLFLGSQMNFAVAEGGKE